MTLISVITPTWQRADLLIDRCIPSVRAQTWLAVEHIVVSDGPDRSLGLKLAGQYPSVVYAELPDHPDGPVDYGSRTRNRGLELANGDLVAYLDDDNAWRPEHLELLAKVMVDGIDFAYSAMVRHPGEDVIGAESPRYGGLDTSTLIHRRGLPERCGPWPLPDEIDGDKHAPDWAVVKRWLDSGATWARVAEVTVDYYFPGGDER